MASANYMNLKTRIQKQQKKKNRRVRVYHSFLTIVLLLVIFQISYSALLNFAKIVVYQAKIAKAQELFNQADTRNKHLKNEIQNFSSMKKVEAIARNNLKMAAKDEVLIIINQPQEKTTEKKQGFSTEILNFFESFTSKFDRDLASEKLTE